MPASVALLLCTILAVSDGDTLTARCSEGAPTLSIRLAEIDAPEKGQPFGRASRASLAGLCLDKAAEVRPTAHDRWGRTVAHVSCAGSDASAAQVQAGLAWAFTRYLKGPEMPRLEEAARAARVGLWAEPEPMAPWLWRHRGPVRHVPKPA
ncbi:MAG: thermonuclease family protein [Pseudomonadota bacterium]